MNDARNLAIQLAVQYRPHETHETLWFPKVSAAYRFDNDDEQVMDSIFDILGCKAPLKEEACATGQIPVKRLIASRIACTNLFNHIFPVHFRLVRLLRSLSSVPHRSKQPSGPDLRVAPPPVIR
jgi:hypothetical protein